eukprot:2377770-Rhodomonas_salina.8
MPKTERADLLLGSSRDEILAAVGARDERVPAGGGEEGSERTEGSCRYAQRDVDHERDQARVEVES